MRCALQPVQQAVVQHLGAGHGQAIRGHAEDHVEMQEMLGEGLDPRLPALGLEPAGELPGAGLVGALAGAADQHQPGADDVDVAPFQRAVGGVAPDAAMLLVELDHRGVFAAALRPEQLGHHRAPGRHLARIPGVDLVGQVRLELQVMAGDAGGLQRIDHLPVLALHALVVIGRPGLQRGPGDAVGRLPGIMLRRRQQHVAQHSGLGIQGPGHAPPRCSSPFRCRKDDKCRAAEK